MNATTGAAIAAAATALLTPQLRRGRRGIKAPPHVLGLPPDPGVVLSDPSVCAELRERGLAIWHSRPDGRVRVVCTAPPMDADGPRALALVRERQRANTCRYCELQETPAPNAKPVLGALPDRKGSVHPQCAPAWAAWSAAAEQHAASLAPSQANPGEGLAVAVATTVEKLLGGARGWRGPANQLWKPKLAPASMWAHDDSLFRNLLLHDVEIHRELGQLGFDAWKGADGELRLARNTAPLGAAARALLKASARSCCCRQCNIDEEGTGEALVPLPQHEGGYIHADCWITWQSVRRAAGEYERAQAALLDVIQRRHEQRRQRQAAS